MTEVRFAKDQTEVNQCLKWAKETFHGTPELEDYKDSLWLDVPHLNLKHLIVITSDSKLVGFVRVIPTLMLMPQGYVRSACLTSVVILPSARGKGLSSIMMNEVMILLKKEGFEFSHLIARKAVDHFYNKFGFLGLSSYEKIFIKANKMESGQFSVRPMTNDGLSSCQRFYDLSYSQSFGHVKRDREFWDYSFKRLSLLPGVGFNGIYSDSELIGYYIANASGVLELGIDPSVSNQFLSVLPVENGLITLDIPYVHVLNSIISDDMDVSFRSRRCLFGGHMMCDLNHSHLNTLKSLEDHFKRLGVDIMGMDNSKNFNINFLDQI